MHRYDIAGDKWTEVEKALPEPVSVALCFALGGKIVMFGGEVTPSERGHAGAGNFREERTGDFSRQTENSYPYNLHYKSEVVRRQYMDPLSNICLAELA